MSYYYYNSTTTNSYPASTSLPASMRPGALVGRLKSMQRCM